MKQPQMLIMSARNIYAARARLALQLHANGMKIPDIRAVLSVKSPGYIRGLMSWARKSVPLTEIPVLKTDVYECNREWALTQAVADLLHPPADATHRKPPRNRPARLKRRR